MRALALTILLFAGSAGAQTVYRCGSTFSQEPCAPDAKLVQGAPAKPLPPPDPAKIEAMKALCREYITRVPGWKDRDSVKVGDIYRGKLETKSLKGGTRRVWTYATMVNAKNSYGGYGGEKPALCYVNEGETEVVDLYVAG